MSVNDELGFNFTTPISGGAKNFMESGRKIYRKFTYDIIYKNSHKSK